MSASAIDPHMVTGEHSYVGTLSRGQRLRRDIVRGKLDATTQFWPI